MSGYGYLHVPATPPHLPPGKKPGTHYIVGWVGLRTSLDVMKKRKISRIRTPDRPVRSLVAIPMTLLRLRPFVSVYLNYSRVFRCVLHTNVILSLRFRNLNNICWTIAHAILCCAFFFIILLLSFCWVQTFPFSTVGHMISHSMRFPLRLDSTFHTS